MPTTPYFPGPSKEFSAAKQQYMEQFGSTLVANTYLKIAVLSLCLLCLGLLALNFKTGQIFRNFRPLVIRINEVGRAEAVAYDDMVYQPKEAEIRYFLVQFITQHDGRMRATVRANYGRSLYFLDGRLTDATIESNKKNKVIETFLASQSEEIEIAVRNVTIEDMRTSPYRATVDFERIYLTPGDHIETRREKYVAHLVFVVKDHIPNALVPFNPLGLTITHLREDQAFQ